MKRCTHLPFLAPFAILRRKHSNWQVTNPTATSKEVAGTDNGTSCWLNISIKGAVMDKFIFFWIASEQNKRSIKHVLVFYCLSALSSTQRQLKHSTTHETQKHELTAHVVDADALLYMCYFSSEKCACNKMKEILFGVRTSFRSSMFCMSWHIRHAVFQCKTVRYARSPDCCAFKSVLRRPYPWLETHCRRSQSHHHCRPARATAETFELNPFQPRATGIYLSKGIAKEQGHGRKSYKVFSQNPLYQIEEDVGKISFNKSWGINMLVFYAQNIYFLQKNMVKEQAKGKETICYV